MKFSEIYNSGKFRFSLEIFPPKTPEGIVTLFSELEKLKAIDPAYVSVTYGAMGSTRDLTKDLAIAVHEKLKLNTAFHFTCVGSGRDEIKAYVDHLAGHGINLIVALRGDIPQGAGEFVPPKNGFRYANELVSYLHGFNNFSLAVAGYPEKHIEATSLEADIENLKRKVDAGAEIIITQLFFDNDKFYRWSEKVRAAGIKLPIVAGIMPILKLSQIQRITSMCGASLPPVLLERLQKCTTETEMAAVGIEHATSQCRELIKNHVAGIHFYCLNKAHSVLKVVEDCHGS